MVIFLRTGFKISYLFESQVPSLVVSVSLQFAAGAGGRGPVLSEDPHSCLCVRESIIPLASPLEL